MEYPGYSLYKSDEPSESAIYRDAEIVLDFVMKTLLIQPEKIVLVGRSIGSGPVCHLASQNKVAAAVLISPFISIKRAVADIAGTFGSMLIKERFNNVDKVKNFLCPLLIIHGLKDELISKTHSEVLYGRSTNNFRGMSDYVPTSLT